MSGSQATYPFPLTLGLNPPEGSKGVSVTIPWNGGAANPYPINLLTQFNSGNFSTPQSVWIDNSSVPWPMMIVAEQQQQNIMVPPFSQGVYPLVIGQAPIFQVSLISVTQGGNQSPPLGTSNLTFFNVPQVAWQQPAKLQLTQWVGVGLTNLTPNSYSANVILGPAPTPYYREITSVMLSVGCSGATTAAQTVSIYLVETGFTTPFFADMIQLPISSTGAWYRTSLVNFSNPPWLSENSGIALFCNAPLAANTLFATVALTYTLVMVE